MNAALAQALERQRYRVSWTITDGAYRDALLDAYAGLQEAASRSAGKDAVLARSAARRCRHLITTFGQRRTRKS